MFRFIGSLYALSVIGFFAMTMSVHASDETLKNNQDKKSLTSIFLSFFKSSEEKDKDTDSLEIVLDSTDAPKNSSGSGQYIFLTEDTIKKTNGLGLSSPQKSLVVSQSFEAHPTVMFSLRSAPPVNEGSNNPIFQNAFGMDMAGNRLTFSYGEKGKAPSRNAFAVSLSSSFLVDPTSPMSPLYEGSSYEGLTNRSAYNLSLDLDYAGFNIGASFSQEKDTHDPGLKGYDIGLGYRGNSWSTDIRFADYRRERDLLFTSTENYFDQVYAFEIGAAYHIYSNIRLSGRFTYYTYGQNDEMEGFDNNKVFLLGTNVNF